MYLALLLVLLPLCNANECLEAVEEACHDVIVENNDQLLETMEEMVANRSCDVSNPLFDDQLKDDLILNISNQFKDIKEDLEITRNTTKEQFEQLSQKLVRSILGK